MYSEFHFWEQTIIAKQIFKEHLAQFSLNAENKLCNQLFNRGNSNCSHFVDSFFMIGSLAWASNGDAMSRAYTGTQALKRDVVRTGKRNVSGMVNDGVNSLSRYFISNFKDKLKQVHDHFPSLTN